MVFAHDGLDLSTEFDTWRRPLFFDRVSAGPYHQFDAAQQDRGLSGRLQIAGPKPACLQSATRVIVAVGDNRWSTRCCVVACPDELETLVAS